MTADEEAQLRAERNRISDLLHAIDSERTQAEWKAQIGKCYKRSYATGITYVTVTGAEESGYPVAFEFDDGARSIASTFRMYAPSFDLESYIEITREDFDAAWRAFVAKIAALDPYEVRPPDADEETDQG